MSYVNWKKAKATSLQEAFWLVKEYGKARRNLSVARTAELMGLDDESLLYKWMKNGSMPVQKLHSFEYVCGANFVSEYLASSDNKLLIDIPIGKPLRDVSVIEMQGAFNDAMSLLIKFASGNASTDETVAALTRSMSDLAYHRENVLKVEAPELDFGEE
ncbi:MAG: hypothetical protein COW76_20385 [Shewanella sp. CG18_big_fil_WC_8_21_14_2_50_42_11]|uniref:hypothetical protein n=1 Tax=Shewanella sp. CG18_big_fil_WC_8_21_14_2_50_42_11 TaxID=1975538 RepID=UPI000C40D767|nr:hypothetical protein [Shewanella sp. CG18_big_fil_WC_8_21_14_2_50_42_11]PIP98522.1 MAG: hypothetical protein COW76_20385 [Shewanella sp. CG18_big_fil_WC_8_21_14_2_50_42_11]